MNITLFLVSNVYLFMNNNNLLEKLIYRTPLWALREHHHTNTSFVQRSLYSNTFFPPRNMKTAKKETTFPKRQSQMIMFNNLHLFSGENRFGLFNKLLSCVTVKGKKKRRTGDAAGAQASHDGLAFLVVVPLVLIPEQRLVTLHPVRPGAQGACGGGEDDGDDHKGSDYRHGDDFSQSERLS